MAATSGAFAAGASTPADSSVVAQAGSIRLDGSDVRALVASLPAQTRTAVRTSLSSLEQVVQGDLVRRAVLQDAEASGFDRLPGTVSQLNQVRDEALVNLWIASKAVVPADYPSESELQAAYAANQQALASPTEYRVAQIFIAAPDGGDPAKLAAALRKAADVAARINAGDFSQLAEQQSEDPQSAAQGGDLGYLPENRIMPDILAAVRRLSPGQVVGPVKTAQGLRFLKLLEKRPGTVPTLAQVHDQLVSALRRRRAAQLQQAYLLNYRTKLAVAVNQIELAKLQQTLPR
ncbi:MAG TPA: peptidylprolyl isomerase [Steroidobacteraceae bacterium]|nr:peptidylprolyl isomerase [Steroidobacteraceae bacterium]